MTPTPFQVLSIDGGGFLGMATAKFIEQSERHFEAEYQTRVKRGEAPALPPGAPGPWRFSEAFDLFCGTSTGVILALGLAAGRSGAQLADLYTRLGQRVFARPRWELGGGYLIHARYSNRVLARFLAQEFAEPGGEPMVLDDVWDGRESNGRGPKGRGKAVLVTAFNLTAGRPRVFKTDHAPELTLDGDLRLADLALASSAAPFYFPAVPVHNPRTEGAELFCDGGVVANHPALLGFTEAVSVLRRPPECVRILSLTTPGEGFGEGTATLNRGDRGLARWGAKLPPMFIESGTAIADQVLRRLIAALPEGQRPLYHRVPMVQGAVRNGRRKPPGRRGSPPRGHRRGEPSELPPDGWGRHLVAAVDGSPNGAEPFFTRLELVAVAFVGRRATELVVWRERTLRQFEGGDEFAGCWQRAVLVVLVALLLEERGRGRARRLARRQPCC
ncbi:patatin : Patatin OS=Herpetosiphon aurantiacus (strain ATCC 23779 / DSM 785) GN=Haur_2542 PE=4 SV=1: Patatin [Gemmata massiliana]|uniref:PNPLA domain-containing protein n=1 Tax=Gemmata massiliana TaxID=1210884 RepID=A0A6P2CVF7_9BACT|nr:patatin-like phospholipase family protein [Gemmata massiliana]VTR91704.1 patatin : Patatin OS=Herpetosiphon aurantiacus (strain ATCC 23779 / DSM 785) GN=Haur_2542 PE=4 SV=1: Patatin [Gemmata massiliana]